MADLDLLSLYSAYATDKIVYVKEDYVDPSTLPLFASLYPMLTLPHTFGRPVFTKMQWSLDGIRWIDDNLFFIESTGFNNSTVISFSTSTTINLLLVVPSPIYYRVIGFWIDDYDGTNPDVQPMVGGVAPLYFDSRLNYRKIIRQEYNLSTGGNVTDVFRFDHDQPIPPVVKGYFEMNPGEIWPANWGGVQNTWLVTPTATEMKVYSTATEVIAEHDGYVGATPRKTWMVAYYDG